MRLLDLPIPTYSSEKDPIKLIPCGSKPLIDWTIPDSSVKIMRTLYEGKCCKQSKKRGLKTDIGRKDEFLDFKQLKRRKQKEEQEKCENGIYTSHTQDVSDNMKTEIVTNDFESKNNLTAVKDNQENVTNGTDCEIKTESDSEGQFQIILEDPQNMSPDKHLHAHVVEVGVTEVQS